MSEMLEQVRQNHQEAKNASQVGGNNEGEELPEGSSPLEAREASAEDEGAVTEETSEAVEGDEAPPVAAAGPKIRIGSRTFDSQDEAITYAEELEREKLISDSHSAGIREALEATRQPAQPEPEPEDNFEERFYANPKEALKAAEDRATQRAVATIKAEQAKEGMWNEFLTENPDLRRADAERILGENWETIGKMTDLPKAKKLLAQKTRAYYDEIIELRKPRTELKAKPGTAVSPGGTSPQRVTPTKKDDTPLDFISQMRKLKGHS